MGTLEIDRCIVCFASDFMHKDSENLYDRLESRLEWVDTETLPDIELVNLCPTPSWSEDEEIFESQEESVNFNKVSRNAAQKEQPSSEEHEETNTEQVDCHEKQQESNKNGCVFGLETLSSGQENLHSEDFKIDKQIYPNTCITSELRRFFVLKYIFNHPLNHVTTQKMMLLVQSPSDWFSICSPCADAIDHGIKTIENLQSEVSNNNMETFHTFLQERVLELQQKFVTSYVALTPPDDWDFRNDIDWEMLECLPWSNFLLTESEAVLEFRQYLHKTSFARLQQQSIKPTVVHTVYSFAKFPQYCDDFHNYLNCNGSANAGEITALQNHQFQTLSIQPLTNADFNNCVELNVNPSGTVELFDGNKTTAVAGERATSEPVGASAGSESLGKGVEEEQNDSVDQKSDLSGEINQIGCSGEENNSTEAVNEGLSDENELPCKNTSPVENISFREKEDLNGSQEIAEKSPIPVITLSSDDDDDVELLE